MQRIKEFIKFAVAGLLYYSGLLWLYRAWLLGVRRQSRGLILMYHRVLDDINADTVFTQPGMAVSTAVFERQMSFLKETFSVLPLIDLADYVKSHGRYPGGAAVITFDDGWRDNYTNAFPVLSSHGLPATVFVTTDYVGTTRPFWFLMVKWLLTESNIGAEKTIAVVTDVCRSQSSTGEPSQRLLDLMKNPAPNADGIIEELKLFDPGTLNDIIERIMRESDLPEDYWEKIRPMMSWDEALEMSDRGIEIGSHGCSHKILTHLPDEEVKHELTSSKVKLEHILGKPVRSFSYPNGDHDEFIKTAVILSGYACAVTTKGSPETTAKPDPFALKRLAIHEAVSVGPKGKFSKAMFTLHLTRHL